MKDLTQEQKEFLKATYNASKAYCDRFQELFPEVEPKEMPKLKHEPNKWYNHQDGSIIFYLTNGDSYGYDALRKHKWIELVGLTIDIFPEIYTSAEDSEVIALHKEEMKRRGIGEDTKLKNHADGSKCRNYGSSTVSFNINKIWNKNGCVYANGKWAQPLELTKEQAEKELNCKIL